MESANTTGRWMQIDAACAYMGGISRKTAYAWVAAGLRVARVGDSEARRDSRGRLWQGRMLFNSRWCDEFLEARATGEPLTDLRHEGASRLLEAGWPLHHVQEMLGHSSIEQTSTYLNVERVGLQASMRKIDELRTRCNPVAIPPAIEHPLPCNDEDAVGGQVTVN